MQIIKNKIKIYLRNIVAIIYSYYLILIGKINKVKKSSASGEIILSVYFHNPSKKLFEKCIKWFLNNNYHFISDKELVDIIKNNNQFPRSAVIITVDDGWRENKYNIISVVDKFKIPLTIFATIEPIFENKSFWWSIVNKTKKTKENKMSINSLKTIPNELRMNYVEKLKKEISYSREALTSEELIEINENENIHIGSHTITHPILPMCDNLTSMYEIKESKMLLENKLKKEIAAFAYPNGDFTERECNYLEETGYHIAFTTQPNYIKKSNKINIFQIPRFGVVDNLPFVENLCRMTGVWYERKKYKK